MLTKIVTLAALALICAAQKPTVDVYVGGNNGTGITKIKMRYNIGLKQTVISSRDFNCTAENGCTTDGVSYNITLGTGSYQYYKASVPVNLINQQFNGTLQVVYLYNDTAKLGSVLGLSKDSLFLNYYVQQNQEAGFTVAFNLDSQGDIDFHPFGADNYTSIGAGPFNLVVSTKYGKDWKAAPARLCFANTIDDDATNSSIIGVAAKNYTEWLNFFTANYLKEPEENYFYLVLTDDSGIFVTQLNYWTKDFLNNVNSKNAPLSYVRSVPNELAAYRGCDVFTGNLLLQKFDWHMVYQEDGKGGFDYHYVMRSPRTLIAPPLEKEGGVSGWVILLVLIILGVAGYFVYQWYLQKQQTEALHQDGYTNVTFNPVEMNEVGRGGQNPGPGGPGNPNR